MNREEITLDVAKVVSTILKCEESANISRESHSDWDSLNHVEIIFSLEDKFDFQFPRAGFDELDSISSLVDAISTFLNSEEDG